MTMTPLVYLLTMPSYDQNLPSYSYFPPYPEFQNAGRCNHLYTTWSVHENYNKHMDSAQVLKRARCACSVRSTLLFDNFILSANRTPDRTVQVHLPHLTLFKIPGTDSTEVDFSHSWASSLSKLAPSSSSR